MNKAMPLSLCLLVLLAVGCQAQDQLLPKDTDVIEPILPWCEYWGTWSRWSACSVTCGTGIQIRKRECIRRPCLEAADSDREDALIPVPIGCSGPTHQIRNCTLKPCPCPPVNGSWSKWGCWGECRNGFRQRHRVCNNPIPQGWGTYCSGNPTMTDDCCALYQDIVFSLDASGSIGSANFNEMVNQVHSVIGLMDLDTGSGPADKVRVGIQLFNHGQIEKKHLNNFVLPTLPYSYPSGGTNIGAAITHVNNVMFTTPNGDRPNPPNPNTLVLITDGWSGNQTPSTNNIDRIIVIGVGSNVNPGLVNFASSPQDYFQATNFCRIRAWLMQRLGCSFRFLPRTVAQRCVEVAFTPTTEKETDFGNF